MNREKYILEQLTDDEIINKIDINLSVTQLNEIIDEAQGSGISVEEYLAVVDKEEKIVIEKDKYKDSFKNIIDIYELGMNPEKYIEKGIKYLIINPNGNHLVLLPVDEYNEMTKS